MEVRQVHRSDGRLLRELHLRMYADSPNAFGESLAEAQAMPMQRWTGRARKLAESDDAIGFVAVEADQTIGFIVGYVGRYRDGLIQHDARETVTLARAWVDPQVRRRGIGQALANAVISWARTKAARELEVQVTQGNVPATSLYCRLGFADTGRREPLLSNRDVQICFLSRRLEPA
jgi:ribosomal protein S18 acetylase RimI-like enzyme